ncbi:MAG: hypothetical protein ACREP7_20350, partial [Lysobacter sp.]
VRRPAAVFLPPVRRCAVDQPSRRNTMSHATVSARSLGVSLSPDAARRVLAGLSALLLVVAMLFSGRAAADPVVAGQLMQTIGADRQVLDLQLQTARQQTLNQDYVGARTTFLAANIQAMKIGTDLARLQQENQDSLDRGLYRNRIMLERAIRYVQVSSTNLQAVAMDLQQLAQVPYASQSRLDVDSTLFRISMTQVEQAMANA